MIQSVLERYSDRERAPSVTRCAHITIVTQNVTQNRQIRQVNQKFNQFDKLRLNFLFLISVIKSAINRCSDGIRLD